MYPTLISYGSISISSFSVMVLLAFITGYLIGESELKRKGLNGDLADYIFIACFIGGLGGAKVLFLYQQATFSEFIAEPTRYLASGFTFFGGFIGALILIWIVIRIKRVSYLKVTDSLGPCLVLAYAVGRVGCFLVGDDYGIPSTLPWALSFPDGSPPTFEKVHPTQLYDTISMTIVFLVLWKIRKREFVAGWMTAITFIILGSQRFLIELIRSTSPSFIPGVSQAQIISVVFIILGMVMLYRIKKTGTKS